jgi:ferredoxin
MRIEVDRAACEGHARCHEVSPELFPLDELGYSAVESLNVEGADRELASRAAFECPERAIKLAEH